MAALNILARLPLRNQVTSQPSEVGAFMTDIDLDVVFHTDDVSPQIQDSLRQRFHHAGCWVMKRFGVKQFSVSISVVDDESIQRVNAQYLQHDWPTDVVSFVFQSPPEVIGEVIASWTTAQRLGRVAQWSASDELVLYILHGMLHLVGLDDTDEAGRQKMRSMEYEYLVAAEIPEANLYLQNFDRVADESA